MLPPRAIFALKIHLNAFTVGASFRTPLGTYSAPQTPSWFSAGRFVAEEENGEGEGRGENEERVGRGAFPHFL